MSFSRVLSEITKTGPFSGQVLLKNGVNVMAPRRCSAEEDPEFPNDVILGPDEYQAIFAGMLVLPGPGGQPTLVKGFFDAAEIVAMIPIDPESMPKVGKSGPSNGSNRIIIDNRG